MERNLRSGSPEGSRATCGSMSGSSSRVDATEARQSCDEPDADGVQHTETRDAREMCITDRGARADGARRDVPRRRRTKRTARRRYPLSSHTCVHGRRSLFGSGQEYAARLLSIREKRQDSDRRPRALPRRLGSRLVEGLHSDCPANRLRDRASRRSRIRRSLSSRQPRHRHGHPLVV